MPRFRPMASASSPPVMTVQRACGMPTSAIRWQFYGLGGRVWDASFSPDGKHFVTGGEDNIARVWDGKTGALQATLAGHSLMIYAVAFSPDSKRIVTSSADKTARVWD